jgi:hypothetical protein
MPTRMQILTFFIITRVNRLLDRENIHAYIQEADLYYRKTALLLHELLLSMKSASLR